MKRWRSLFLVACAACVPDLGPFDCSRPGATCGAGGVCVASTGRCAEPAGDCPSGLRYAGSAGALAGQCVGADIADAGSDASLDAPVADAGPVTFTTGQQADLVLGQSTFTGMTANAFGAGGASLSGPVGICSDGVRLLVADSANHRVLVWSTLPQANGRAANFAIGQADLTGTTPGGGPSKLHDPQLIACDSGRLVVADRGNHRVLVWPNVPTGAGQYPTIALGQTDLYGSAAGAGTTGLSFPRGAALAGIGGPVVVSDSGNHRVLVWSSAPEQSGAAADWVLGQADFSGTSPDRGGAAGPGTVDTPGGLAFEGPELLVVDRGNHRVLLFATLPGASGVSASAVIGQADLGGSQANRGGTPSADTLRQPSAVCSGPGFLAVVDTENHRVLVFSPSPAGTGAVASAVLGQKDVTTGSAGPSSESSLRSPGACAFAGGALWVTDTGNNRVVRYSPAW